MPPKALSGSLAPVVPARADGAEASYAFKVQAMEIPTALDPVDFGQSSDTPTQ